MPSLSWTYFFFDVAPAAFLFLGCSFGETLSALLESSSFASGALAAELALGWKCKTCKSKCCCCPWWHNLQSGNDHGPILCRRHTGGWPHLAAGLLTFQICTARPTITGSNRNTGKFRFFGSSLLGILVFASSYWLLLASGIHSQSRVATNNETMSRM